MIHSKKRKNMQHFSKVHAETICKWFQTNRSFTSLRARWKLDGFFLRFGKDQDGAFWFQTARSDILRDPEAVLWYALQKGYNESALARAQEYLVFLNALRDSAYVRSLPKDIVVECEVFNRLMAEQKGGQIKFVNVEYDSSFFKTDFTFFIYRTAVASTDKTLVSWTEDPFLYRHKNFTSYPAWFRLDIDVEPYAQMIDTITSNGKNTYVLRSMSNSLRAAKLEMKEQVERVVRHFEDEVLVRAAEKSQMGQNFEGVVLSVNNVDCKITTPYFRSIMVAQKESCNV